MKRCVSFFIVALVIFGFLSTQSFAETCVLKLGHAYSDSNTMHIALKKFAEVVEQETNGKMQVHLLHSGVLGGEMELIAQVIGENLDSAMIGGVTMLQTYDKRAAIEDLPFLFRDVGHGRNATDGLYGEMVKKEIIEPLGVKLINYLEHGFRQITNNKRAIYVPKDMEGLKLRVPQLPLRIEALRVLGTNPVPISLPELFTALQQGTVDGQENPLSTIESSKFYEVQKFLSLSNHTYNMAFTIMNNKVWNSLSNEQQEALLKAGEAAKQMSRDLYEREHGRIIETIKSAGVKVNEIDTDAFRRAVEPVWEKFGKEYGIEFLNAAIEADI